MNRDLINIANLKGIVNGKQININSNETIAELPDVYDIIMSADREIWIDGPLTYTILVRNITNNQMPFAINVPDISDITVALNLTIVILDESTIRVNDRIVNPDDYDFNSDTGILTINFLTLKPGEEMKATFEVNKRTNNWTILEEIAYFKCNPIALDSNVVMIRNGIRRVHQSGRCYDPYWRRNKNYY